jgi:hypothetical protein
VPAVVVRGKGVDALARRTGIDDDAYLGERRRP